MQDPANPSAEVVIRRFDEQHNKYKFMEANLTQKKKRQVLTLLPPCSLYVVGIELLL